MRDGKSTGKAKSQPTAVERPRKGQAVEQSMKGQWIFREDRAVEDSQGQAVEGSQGSQAVEVWQGGQGSA